MTATPLPETLAALPLLAEAGVSVYWVPLDGRTAWVADADTRQVWISRAIPREALLRHLIEALQFVDEEAGSGRVPRTRGCVWSTPPDRAERSRPAVVECRLRWWVVPGL